MNSNKKILAVDDDELNRVLLSEYLRSSGHDVIEADDGDTALTLLEQTPGIDAIVLDSMMPRVGGLAVLEAVKSHPRFADIPVIMQSGNTAREHLLEGIRGGAYYYLTKPYEFQMLLAIVTAALGDAATKKKLRDEVSRHKSAMGLMEQSRFRFRTLEEARNLAFFIANRFPHPEAVVYGLNEMLINAVEHGNLGIDYKEKTDLIITGQLFDEIERRLKLPEYKGKEALLSFTAHGDKLSVRIKDQGQGFDWREYLEISPERATHAHGRGIATSRLMSFSSIEYLGCGNEVECIVAL